MSVGERIKQLREDQKLTLEELAERSSLKVSDIEKIEEGGIIPSLSPLVKISRVMGVRLGTFLDDCESVGPVVTPRGEEGESIRFSSKTNPEHGELSFHSLAQDKAGRHMEPFMIEVEEASGVDFPSSSHEGEEFLYVLTGSIEISYGKDKLILEQGDSIYYDSVVPHHVHRVGSQKTTILAVVYAPI